MNAKLILDMQQIRKENLEIIAYFLGRPSESKDVITDAQVLIAELNNQNTDHEMFWKFV